MNVQEKPQGIAFNYWLDVFCEIVSSSMHIIGVYAKDTFLLHWGSGL